MVRLYPALLGDRWHQVAVAIRLAHLTSERVTGSFTIRHGRNPIARLLARLPPCPPAGDAVPATLRIHPSRRGERWVRELGPARLVTDQSKADGLLAERLGPLELRFRLRPRRGCLHFDQTAARLRLGPISLPIPRSLQPVVSASETVEHESGPVEVHVDVRLPVVGRLLRYEGRLETPAARP